MKINFNEQKKILYKNFKNRRYKKVIESGEKILKKNNTIQDIDLLSLLTACYININDFNSAKKKFGMFFFSENGEIFKGNVR